MRKKKIVFLLTYKSSFSGHQMLSALRSSGLRGAWGTFVRTLHVQSPPQSWEKGAAADDELEQRLEKFEGAEHGGVAHDEAKKWAGPFPR